MPETPTLAVRGEINSQSYLAVNPVSYNNNLKGKICLQVQLA